MNTPSVTLVTTGLSVVAMAIARLLDHYHYGNPALRRGLRKRQATIRRIKWKSFAQITLDKARVVDKSIFGVRLWSKRAFGMAIVLLVTANVVPTAIDAALSPNLILGVLCLALGFGSISMPLGIVSLYAARLVLRKLPPTSVSSGLLFIGAVVLAAQLVLLLWISIFAVLLTIFATVCYQHYILFSDSAPLGVAFSIVAMAYSRIFLPVAIFPLAAYLVIALATLVLQIVSIINRITDNFVRSQIKASKVDIFSEATKTIAACAVIVAGLFDLLTQVSLGEKLTRFENVLQNKAITHSIHLTVPACAIFVERPREFKAYLFVWSVALEVSWEEMQRDKSTIKKTISEAGASFVKRWGEHLKPPVSIPDEPDKKDPPSNH